MLLHINILPPVCQRLHKRRSVLFGGTPEEARVAEVSECAVPREAGYG